MTTVVEAFDHGMNQSGLWTVVFLVGSTLLITVIHEAGHLLAALGTGQRDIALHVGSHGTIMNRRLGQLQVRANVLAAPWMPAGYVSFNARRATARDMALIAAAGPAASILGAFVTGCLVVALGSGKLAELLAMSTVFGVLLGFGNLIPVSIQQGTKRKPRAPLETDGLQLIRALRVMFESRGG